MSSSKSTNDRGLTPGHRSGPMPGSVQGHGPRIMSDLATCTHRAYHISAPAHTQHAHTALQRASRKSKTNPYSPVTSDSLAARQRTAQQASKQARIDFGTKRLAYQTHVSTTCFESLHGANYLLGGDVGPCRSFFVIPWVLSVPPTV